MRRVLLKMLSMCLALLMCGCSSSSYELGRDSSNNVEMQDDDAPISISSSEFDIDVDDGRELRTVLNQKEYHLFTALSSISAALSAYDFFGSTVSHEILEVRGYIDTIHDGERLHIA